MQKLEIQYIDINKLKPYKNNAKIHTQDQIEEIKKSISDLGMNDPIGIWGEKNIVVEGHGRLTACKQLGMKEVPIIRLDTLTDEQRRAYALVHNQLTMNTGFDDEKLKIELRDISFDMSCFGFDDNESDDSTIEEPGEIIEDEIPELPDEPKSKYGDVYFLGDHKLMCGDATKIEDLEKLMDCEKADMVLTDPPYNVNISNSKNMKIKNDNMENKEFDDFLSKVFNNMVLYIKDGGAFYVWYASKTHVNFENALKSAGLDVRQQLIWVKSSLVLGRQDYQWKHEPCMYGWKDGATHYFINDRTQTTTIESGDIDFDNLSKEKAIEMLKDIYSKHLESTVIVESKPKICDLHPTMKPINLIAKLVNNSSKSGEKVLDLFGGSGTTLIACEQLKRKCYMMELDPHYMDVIIQRWENLTGKKAEKL